MRSAHSGIRILAHGARGLLCWLLPAGLWLAALACPAQESAIDDVLPRAAVETGDKPPAETKPAATGAAQPTVPAGRIDMKYLEGPDGRPVLVPNVTWEEVVKWLDQRQAPADEGPPGVSVSSLSFDGSADDEQVLLTARVELQVSVEKKWVRVPLFMAEGTLRSPSVYTGEGLAVPATYHADEGYAWWIKGAGRHQLSLSFSIPLRKQAAQRRVQLSLPTTAVSELKLRIAAPRVVAKAPDRSTVSTRTTANGTEIDVIGLGNRLDLAWNSLPEPNAAANALEVTTAAVATLVDGESATLEATQLIQSLGQQGSFDEVRVSLPAGYELLRLEGAEHRDHKLDPANPRQVLVQLKKPTAGPIELKWTVARPKLPPVGEAFTLEGFEVDRARLQTGYLAVVVVGDFRMIRQPDEDKFVQRVDLAELPGTLRQTPANAAFRYLNRLTLHLKLQRIEPYVKAVDAAVLLHVTRDAIELEGSCRLQILRGSIAGFKMRWDDWKKQGWAISEAELPGHIELRVSEDPAEPELIRLEFAEPAKGMVDLRFRARRTLMDVGERMPLTLPVPDVYYGSVSTLLALVTADNIEADLQPAESTQLRPLGAVNPRIVVPDDWRGLRRADYRIESPQAELSLGLSLHPRKIQAKSAVEAAIRSSAVTVKQRIAFDVAYERIAQLRFAVPDGVPAEQLRFFSQSGKELSSAVVPKTARSPAEIRVTLEAPAIGRFEVEVRYALAPTRADPDVRETVLSIPLVRSNDVALTATRFSCRDAAGRDVVVEGEGWLRQLAPDGQPVWVLSQAPEHVSVRVAHQGGAPHRGRVSKILIRTRISGDGTTRSFAQYQLAEGISELALGFPSNLTPVEFWWNQKSLPVEAGVKTADGATYYEIALRGRAPAGERLLTVEFLQRSEVPSRFSEGYSLESPRFSDEQIAAQVHWQVELPLHQHLFTEPAGFTPEFRWRAGRIFWSRQTELSEGDLDNWIGGTTGPALPNGQNGPGDGNRYVFEAFGPPPHLAFRAMSRSGIVLVGAGTALFVGLILVKWPATRHVLTMLAAGFLVSLLGIWFAAPVQVLLQPAVLGLALAIFAAAIDGFLYRRSRSVTVTLTSPSGFITSPSSHPRSPAGAVGSNEFTSLRPPPEAPVAPELSELGNRS